MVGKLLPYVVIGLIQIALVATVGRLLFNVPIRGSILDLYIAALFFILFATQLPKGRTGHSHMPRNMLNSPTMPMPDAAGRYTRKGRAVLSTLGGHSLATCPRPPAT